jgi:hypothetical protein
MSFLNSALFAALIPLVSLPLIIHLLNKRFPKLFYFSSIRNIRRTVAERARIHRWRHRILLVIRTIFLLLILLAFLKPVMEKFGSGAPGAGDRHVLLVLDHSLSMEYKGEGVSSRQRAIVEAEKIIDTLGADDLVNIMLVGQNPSFGFIDFSRNHAEAKRFLKTLKPGLTRADFSQANAAAARLVQKANARPEIYYLSDFQRKNWANVDFTALPPNARLFFVDAGTRLKDNRAILGATLHQAQALAGDTVTIEVTVGNFSDEPFQDRLSVLLNQRSTFNQEVFVAPWSVGKVNLPVPVGAPGLHLCEINLPADGLEQDNRFYLTIPVLEKEEVLIVSDDANPKKDAVYFLQTALNPYDDLGGSLLPRHIGAAEVNAAQLASAKKVFLTRSGRLSETGCAALAQFLFSGGGMLYFLDGEFDRENLELIEKAIGPGTMPLKLTTKRVAENVGAGAQQIIKGDFKSKHLRLFRGAMRQDLALLEFYDYYHASSTGAGNILLTYTDESPAMAGMGHGLGTLLLLNFSVSEFSSNLARQRIFPAWMQELVKTISNDEPVPAAYAIGETIQAEVWRSELRGNEFKSPSGREVALKREALGERYGIAFAPDELGFYTLAAGRLLYAFGVNAHPDEADLRAVDRALLPEQMKEGQQAHFLEGQEDYENVVLGKRLFHYFILGGLALLLLEMGFQMLVRRA